MQQCPTSVIIITIDIRVALLTIQIRQGLGDTTFNCTNSTQISALKHKLELYLIVDDIAPSTTGVRTLLEQLDDTDIENVHQNFCDYWSSHVMNNCTEALADIALVEAHRVLRMNSNGCSCAEPFCLIQLSYEFTNNNI